MLAAIIFTVLGGVVREPATCWSASKQYALGRIRTDANTQRFKVTGEAFGGIKDVKVLQREGAFVERFRPASWKFSRTTANNAVISALPKFLFETIAFGGIVAIVLYFVSSGDGVAEILPVISIYALRGLPADARAPEPVRQLLGHPLQPRRHRRLDRRPQAVPAAPRGLRPAARGAGARAPRGLRRRHVPLPRQRRGRRSTRVSIEIPKNQTVGLVGPSGSGKTTLVDLLLGLYAPAEGRIVIDDVALDAETVRAWKRRVGYVPQQIFLSDDTIAANIAFGVPASNQIDHARVETVARQAHLHAFVTELPRPSTAPSSASAACGCPAGSASGSGSRARSTTTPTCW